MNYKELNASLRHKEHEPTMTTSSKNALLNRLIEEQNSIHQQRTSRKMFSIAPLQFIYTHKSAISGIAAILVVSLMIWRNNSPSRLNLQNGNPHLADTTLTKQFDSTQWHHDSVK